MRITKRQLMSLIREQVEEVATEPLPPEESGPNPVVQDILDQMETLTVDDLRVVWHAVADISKRKQKELKVGFKKGDKVAWIAQKSGNERTGVVVRKGGKFVMIQPDGDNRVWKKYPSSLRKL